MSQKNYEIGLKGRSEEGNKVGSMRQAGGARGRGTCLGGRVKKKQKGQEGKGGKKKHDRERVNEK